MCLKSNISKSTPSNGDTFVHLKTLEESKAALSEVPYCCLFHSATVVMSETWSTYLETLLGLFYPPGEWEALWTNFVSAGRLNRQDFPGSFDWSSVSDASGHSEHIVLPHGFGNPIWLELGSRNAFGFFHSEKQKETLQHPLYPIINKRCSDVTVSLLYLHFSKLSSVS